jgi:hypothetical protein
MLDTLDRNFGRAYNKIICNRIVSRTEKILPFVTHQLFGIDVNLPPNYSMLKETMKEYGYTIVNTMKKYLM